MTRNRICLFGESPLAQEYAALCVNRGMDAALRLNDEEARRPPSTPVPKGVRKLRQPQKQCDLALELTVIARSAKKRNLEELDDVLAPHIPILSTSVTMTVAEQAKWLKHPERLVGIGAFPTLLEGTLIEVVSPGPAGTDAIHAAVALAQQLGKETVFVHDAVGLVFPRILSMLANEAMFAVMENVAAPCDIDTAMKLGVNYPQGPLAWADRIGRRYVRAIMLALARSFGEDRYRVAPLLQTTD